MNDPRPALPDHATAQLDRALRDAQIDSRLPSIVAAVYTGEEVAWTGAAGFVGDATPTPDTQYRIGSITKTMVAVGIMRLRDEGVLALADPVAEHLPGGGGVDPATLGRATVGQVLMHAAGTPAETTGPWWERAPGGDLTSLLADLRSRPTAGMPGQRFHYSNVGYGLLGAVLLRHRGTSWEDVVTQEVLLPLGMDRTTPRPTRHAASGSAVHPWADAVLPEPEHDAGAMAPAGQMWSSIIDLARWGRFLGGDTGEVLHAETLAEMLVPGMVDHRPGAPWTGAHGLGIQVFNIDGRITVGHGGSMPGFLAAVQATPDGGPGVALLANTTTGLDPSLLARLMALAVEHLPDTRPPWRPRPLAAESADILGIWYWGPRAHELRSTVEGLHLSPLHGPGRASRFEPVQDGWMGRDGYYAGEPLRIVRNDDGTVRHLDLASFILTRSPYDPAADVPGGVSPDGWG